MKWYTGQASSQQYVTDYCPQCNKTRLGTVTRYESDGPVEEYYCPNNHRWSPHPKDMIIDVPIINVPVCRCKELGYKCPACYADSCFCGGRGCNSCEPQGRG